MAKKRVTRTLKSGKKSTYIYDYDKGKPRRRIHKKWVYVCR